jgi:hypothetical protein
VKGSHRALHTRVLVSFQREPNAGHTSPCRLEDFCCAMLTEDHELVSVGDQDSCRVHNSDHAARTYS